MFLAHKSFVEYPHCRSRDAQYVMGLKRALFERIECVALRELRSARCIRASRGAE